jgi:hypothetical protein
MARSGRLGIELLADLQLVVVGYPRNGESLQRRMGSEVSNHQICATICETGIRALDSLSK